MLELKTLVAQLLYHFYLEPIDLAQEVTLIQDLVLRPMQPIQVKFVTRVNENLIESSF